MLKCRLCCHIVVAHKLYTSPCAGCKEYSTAIDMWSLGCIMAELLTKQVLFSEQGEIPQLHKIFGLLGTPSEDNWPGVKKLKVMQQVSLLGTPDPEKSFVLWIAEGPFAITCSIE